MKFSAMMKNKIVFAASFAFSFSLWGQMNNYHYSRKINGISEKFQSLEISDDVYGKIRPDLSDIRIYAVNAKDTIETPYYIETGYDRFAKNDIHFKFINKSRKDNVFFFTFNNATSETINTICLKFGESNYDRRITLEGSNDQKEWFVVLEKYRIVSIQNNYTDYIFNTVHFSDVNYVYLRISVPESIQPDLTEATLSKEIIEAGNYREYNILSKSIKENKPTKKTEIEITLPMFVPVSCVSLGIKSTFDYYRPVEITCITDSSVINDKVIYQYFPATTSVISSLEKPVFKFNNIITKKILISIANRDNIPLAIDSISVSGNVNKIIARFDDPAGNYQLVYGNNKASAPDYDIELFKNKIPKALKQATLEAEISFSNENETARFILSKIWLWIVMGLIIITLGGFTISMMRKK
jgi:hypothetical protein